MPARARHRAATVALAAALVGGVPLVAGAAWADHAAWAEPEGGVQITFSADGIGLLLCSSDPDQARLSVAAESTVTFVNRIGRQATLRVDGQDAGGVGANQAVQVVFHRGPVAVSMVPQCGVTVSQSFGTVTVEVVPAPEGAPPAPSAGTPAAAGPTGGGTAPPAPAWQQPADPPTVAGDTPTADLPASGATHPQGDAADKTNTDNTLITGSVAVSTPIPVAPAPKGADGLLALVAMVCVIGAGAGAIRAILAQRASRARVA